jgi:hypothetical protein
MSGRERRVHAASQTNWQKYNGGDLLGFSNANQIEGTELLPGDLFETMVAFHEFEIKIRRNKARAVAWIVIG